jgi:hypothetical protein
MCMVVNKLQLWNDFLSPLKLMMIIMMMMMSWFLVFIKTHLIFSWVWFFFVVVVVVVVMYFVQIEILTWFVASFFQLWEREREWEFFLSHFGPPDSRVHTWERKMFIANWQLQQVILYTSIWLSFDNSIS